MSDPLVVVDEPQMVWAALDHLWLRLEESPAKLPPEKLYLRLQELETLFGRRRQVELEELALIEAIEFRTQPMTRFHGNIPLLVEELRRRAEEGQRSIFLAPSTGDVERMADIFKEYGVNFQIGSRQLRPGTDTYLEEKSYLAVTTSSTVILKGIAPAGMVLPADKLAIFGNEDQIGRAHV